MMKKGSKWGKVREVVFKRAAPTTSAWSRIDMSVLFPELYREKTVTGTSPGAMAGRVLPKGHRLGPVRQVYIPSQSVGLYSLRLLDKVEILCVGFGNGKFNLHNSKTCKRIHTIEASPDGMPVTSIRDYLDTNGHRIVAGTADGWIRSYKLMDDSSVVETAAMHFDDPIYSIDTSENYHICALSTRQIKVIDGRTCEYVREVGHISEDELAEDEEIGHGQRVTCVRFNPSEKYTCVSGSWDRTVYLWDIRVEKAAVREIKGPKICGDGLDISGDKCLTASFFTENALQLWDLGSGKLIENIPYRDNANEAEYLYSCRFVDSQRVYAGGTGTMDAKVINRKTGEVEGAVFDAKPIHSVDYSNGTIVAGGTSCYVHVADFNSQHGD